MEWKSLLIWISVSILLVLPSVFAVPPATVVSTAEEGFGVEYPLFGVIKQNYDHHFSFLVYNKTSGYPIIDGIVCYFHLHNNSGSNLYNASVNTTTTLNDYEFIVGGGNFSEEGIYSFLMGCNDTKNGVFVAERFAVTANGTESTEAQATLYLGLLIVVILLFITLLTLAYKIDGKDEIQMGYIVKINAKKHFKTALYLLSYLLFIFLTYLLWVISKNFLFELGSEIFRIFFFIAWIGVFPVIILLLIKMFIDIITNKELVNLAKRGLKWRGKTK